MCRGRVLILSVCISWSDDVCLQCGAQELGIVVYHFGGAQDDGEEMVLACVPLFKAKQVLSCSLLVSSLPIFGEINLAFGAVRAPRRMSESEKSR